MIVRGNDSNGDWTFGRGKSDYLDGVLAVAQNVTTRLRCFLGDCFFDKFGGVDWFNLMGGKDLDAIRQAVYDVISGTDYVTSVVELSVTLDKNRGVVVVYSAQTAFPGSLIRNQGYLLTEGGDILTTEDGDELHA